MLLGSVRAGDSVYRLGGEEFLVVLPGADAELACGVAERIRAGVKVFYLVGLAPGGRMTLSAGMTHVVDGNADAFAAALEAADAALYASKESGRDRITLHDPAGAAQAPS